MKILLIEDDPTLNANIKEALRSENMIVDNVFDGHLAERMLRQNGYGCIVMDINLPGKSGYELCRQFRSYNQATPVLMLTAFSDLDDKILGYDCGADDYLTKPFFMRELILRIQSLVKRTKNRDNESNQERVSAGDIVIDHRLKKVSRDNQTVELTPREYQILLRLAQKTT
jgi:two-component system OmpR family response regulator